MSPATPPSSRSVAPARGGPALWTWLGLAAIVVALDQSTKKLIVDNLQVGDRRPWTSFFEIVRSHNTGAAFSFLHGAAGWQRWFFLAIALVASVVIVVILTRSTGRLLLCFALAMVLGGAIGNGIDRIVHGYVVDFLHVHQGGFDFPAFNLADSAITLGAICLILDELRRMRRR